MAVTGAGTGAGTGGEVRLVDLDVIKRYSLAVRQEWAPAEEVLAALDSTRDAVLHALGIDELEEEDDTREPPPPPATRRRGARSERRRG